MIINPNQSLKPQPKKVFGEVPEELAELKQRLNDLVDAFIFQSSSISIESNFNGFVAKDVKIPASSSLKIQHFLGVIPKWRIILRQTGNGVISDIPLEWDNKTITLKNNGSEDVIISVLIARE
jgi:hypothetical protein